MEKYEFSQYIHIDPVCPDGICIFNCTNFICIHIDPLLLGGFMDPTNPLKLLLLLPLCLCTDSTKHDVFDELTGRYSYDKRIIPQGKDGDSLTVSVSLYVLNLVDMTETG